MEFAALVERLGVRMLHFQEHSPEWDDATWERNRDLLLRDLNRLSIAMPKGQTLTDYGWETTVRGTWRRVGEEPVEPARDPVAEVLQSALPLLVDVPGEVAFSWVDRLEAAAWESGAALLTEVAAMREAVAG